MIWENTHLYRNCSCYYRSINPFGGKLLPLGKLPFDFKWEGSNWGVYFPLGSSILISIILTLILNLLFR